MKKVLLFITLMIGVVSFGQTIILNGNLVKVDKINSFPFWLNEGESLSTTNPVHSISVIEFSLNHSDDNIELEFVQTKNIQQSDNVPVGHTWKVQSILLNDEYSLQNGFMLSIGSHTPDSSVYWSVDAINLKNDLSYVEVTSDEGWCQNVGGSYPYTKCIWYNQLSTFEVISIGDLTFNIELDNSPHEQNVSNCDEPCPEVLITRSYNPTVFEEVNFPIYVNYGETINIGSEDILLSIKEYRK